MHKFGRLIELSLLTILRKGDGYGYKLAEDMVTYNLIDEDVNIGVIYRALRKLENDGFISSTWESGDNGPNKRIYCITEQGLTEMQKMIILIKERRNRIDKLINLNSDLEV